MSDALRAVLLAPGDPDKITGGNLYDRRIVDGLQRLGWEAALEWLPGSFPEFDARARRSIDSTLASLPDGTLTVIDGLALGVAPDVAAAHRERLRLIALVHHPLAEETGLSAAERRRLKDSEERALAQAQRVIASSRFTGRRLLDYGVAQEKIRVVEPGCEPAQAATGSADGTSQHWLCVATVTPRKGHDVLLRALAELPAEGWHCTCIGALHHDEDFARRVLNLQAQLGLQDRVRFIGDCLPDRLDSLWHAADAFVLASHYEGYGMVLTEAVARALPVVATRGGAIPETLPPGTALLAEPGDARDLAEKLRQLLTDAPLRTSLRSRAYEARAALTDWRTASERFAQILADVA